MLTRHVYCALLLHPSVLLQMDVFAMPQFERPNHELKHQPERLLAQVMGACHSLVRAGGLRAHVYLRLQQASAIVCADALVAVSRAVTAADGAAAVLGCLHTQACEP